MMNAILSLVSPIIAARSGAYPFDFFSAMMVLQFIVVLVFSRRQSECLWKICSEC